VQELERAYRKAHRTGGDVPDEADSDNEDSDSDDGGAKVADADKQGESPAVRATGLIKPLSKRAPTLDLIFAYGHFTHVP